MPGAGSLAEESSHEGRNRRSAFAACTLFRSSRFPLSRIETPHHVREIPRAGHRRRPASLPRRLDGRLRRLGPFASGKPQHLPDLGGPCRRRAGAHADPRPRHRLGAPLVARRQRRSRSSRPAAAVPRSGRWRRQAGAATQLTPVATGVNDFLWAPDGSALLCHQRRQVAGANQEIDRRNGAFPTQAKIWDDLITATGTSGGSGTRTHLLRVNLADRRSRDLPRCDHDVPPIALGGAEWRSHRVAASWPSSTIRTRDVAQSTNNDVL